MASTTAAPTATYSRPALCGQRAYSDRKFRQLRAPGRYTLLWVLLWSNAMAILIHIFPPSWHRTGKTLPQTAANIFSRLISGCGGGELAALATDLLNSGRSIGILPALHIPLFPAALITAVVVFLMLAVEL